MARKREHTDILQEVVCSLDLVPVEEVGLAELEVLEVVMLDEGLAGDIETREQPAPPRALLVGHWLALSLHFVVENVNIGLQTSDVISIIFLSKCISYFRYLLPGETSLERVRSGAHILSESVCVVGIEVFLVRSKKFRGKLM